MNGNGNDKNSGKSGRPRIVDVAKAAGVSQTTVSFVLNNRVEEMGISPQTAERVRATMKAMEYEPSRHAQALSTGRSRLLGVIPYKSRNLYRTFMGQRILEGFATVSFGRGYHFAIFEDLAPLTPEREERMRRDVISSEIDALLAITVDYPDEDLREALRNFAGSIPVLTIGTRDEQVGNVRLSVHLPDACEQVWEHFTRQNHEAIGIAYHPETEGTMAIVESFLTCCKEHGAPIREDRKFEVDRTRVEQSAVVERIRASGVTSLFCVFDLIAMKLTFALQKMGVRVPSDISLVGFGNYLTTPHIDPPLTTFAPPMHRIGELSASYLIDRIENPGLMDQPIRQRLRGELLIRGSTAPPGGIEK